MVMLDSTNASVLSYARVGDDGGAIVVSLNMSAQPQQVSLGLAPAGVRGSKLRTLLSSPHAMADARADQPVDLPPYGAWIAELSGSASPSRR
jgi:hypothetical protein